MGARAHCLKLIDPAGVSTGEIEFRSILAGLLFLLDASISRGRAFSNVFTRRLHSGASR